MARNKASKSTKAHKRLLGKSEARAQFLPLVDAVAHGAGPFEITEYGQVVAVLVGKKQYDLIAAQAKSDLKPARNLCGLGELIGDLEKGTKEISDAMQESLKRTIDKL